MRTPEWVNAALYWIVTVHYRSASLLEIVWTFAAVVGLLTTLYLYRQSVIDQDALSRARDYRIGGPRDIVAHANVRNNLYEIVVEAFLVVVGGAAVLTPPTRVVPSAYGIILALGATGIAVLLTVAAMQDFQSRRAFLVQVRLMTVENDRRDRRMSDPL